MSLNGMAESRRLWCHRRVWLKCSKPVARRSQVLPVRACPVFNKPHKTIRQAQAPSPVFFIEAPGRPVFSAVLPPNPNRGRAGRQGSKRTHGPRRLATSRLVEVLVPRRVALVRAIGKACRKSAKPKASRARCFRLAPHPPRWSAPPREGETCCVTTPPSLGPGIRRHSCDGSTVRLAAVTATGVRIGTPEEARLGPPGPAPHLRCKVMSRPPLPAPRLETLIKRPSV